MDFRQTEPGNGGTVARTPLRNGIGPNFRTHNLVQDSRELIFKPSLPVKLIVAVFVVLGVIGVSAGLATVVGEGDPFAGWIMIAVSMLSVWVGMRLYKVSNAPRGLNLRNGTILLPTLLFFSKSNNPETMLFADAEALQIVEKRFWSEEISYSCYELNVVTKSGARYHLVEQADREQIVKDAQTLGRHISCDVLFEEV